MPRCHSRAEVEAYYADFVLVRRTVWVAGDPVAGFLAIDADEGRVTALYVAAPGQGTGRALLDRAKAHHDRLDLRAFVANAGARRFYEREGFEEVGRTAGDNEEGLPDVIYRWERRT